MASNTYDESNIKILEGLDPVRQSPGMFTRTDSPLHIIQECIDNAIDEALAGYAQKVTVELLPDNTVRISDDGRGIPVGPHPEKKISVLQAIFTVLYSGGKFNKSSGGAYSFSGGLHGVGVSVTNALSLSLTATVVRNGERHRIGFADGYVVEPLHVMGPAEGSGTTLEVKPNPKYFDSPEIPKDKLFELLKTKAVLLPGLRIEVTDAREGEDGAETQVFCYENGLPDFLTELAPDVALTPLITGKVYAGPGDESFAEGEGVEWAFSWFERGDGKGRSFVNLIPTPADGTHVAGLRLAIFSSIRNFIDHHSMLPKGLRLTAEDAFRSVRFVLSARMLEPSFDNQTKDRLNSREGVRLVERMTQPHLEAWLNLNPMYAKNIAELVIQHAQARSRAATKVDKARGGSVVMLPGKLSDCESQDSNITELFLVEGDSAGGSAKMARDKHFQAVLPLRGKGLNTWELDKFTAMRNSENQDISTALGIPAHTMEDEVDFTKLRYGKLCILADADVDGYHIQVLLLTLLYRHFPQLIARGHVFVARPPLFRVDVESAGKKRGAKKLYAMDAAELKATEDRLRNEGYSKWNIGRFKGLGEMDPPELYETTLCVDTRRLLQVQLPVEKTQKAQTMFDNLMGRTQAGWRRDWMETRGNEIAAY